MGELSVKDGHSGRKETKDGSYLNADGSTRGHDRRGQSDDVFESGHDSRLRTKRTDKGRQGWTENDRSNFDAPKSGSFGSRYQRQNAVKTTTAGERDGPPAGNAWRQSWITELKLYTPLPSLSMKQ